MLQSWLSKRQSSTEPSSGRAESSTKPFSAHPARTAFNIAPGHFLQQQLGLVHLPILGICSKKDVPQEHIGASNLLKDTMGMLGTPDLAIHLDEEIVKVCIVAALACCNEALRFLKHLTHQLFCSPKVNRGASFFHQNMEASYVHLLRIFANRKDAQAGALIHEYIAKNSSSELSDHVIHMYVKCGKLQDALLVLECSGGGILAWNRIMSGYVAAGNRSEAILLFHRMQLEGYEKPNKLTFITLLQACRCRRLGKRIHEQVIEAGYDHCKFVSTALINMYASCGCLREAIQVFEGIQQRDAACWTSMIAAFAKLGHFSDASRCYRRMLLEGILPDEVSFAAVLHAISLNRDWKQGMWILRQIFETGLHKHFLVATALMTMFGRCRDVKSARRIFRKLSDRPLATWNALLRAHVDNGQLFSALQLLNKMTDESVVPNEDTLLAAMDACVRLSPLDPNLRFAKMVHSKAINHNLECRLGNAILDMYAKCGSLEDVKIVFHIKEQDAFTWNTMVAAYAQHGRWLETLASFRQMKLEGYTPDKAAFIAVVRACGVLKLFRDGRDLHSWILESGLYHTDNSVKYALMTMYARCQSIQNSRKVFSHIEQPDVASWTSMVVACQECGHLDEAARIFLRMQLEGVKPNGPAFAAALSACCSYEEVCLIHACVQETWYKLDLSLGVALLGAYRQCNGRPEEGEEVLKCFKRLDAACCNAMLSFYEQHRGYGKQAVRLFQRLQLEGIRPSAVMLRSLLNTEPMELADAAFLHACIAESGLEAELCDVIVAAYSKCGSIDNAFGVFSKMYGENSSVWNAMFGALLDNGHPDSVFPLFQRMLREGFMPDSTAFANVFRACTPEQAKLLRFEIMYSAECV